MIISLEKRTRRSANAPSRDYRRALVFFPMISYQEKKNYNINRVFLLPGMYETRRSQYHDRRLYRDADQSIASRILWMIICTAVCVALVATVAFAIYKSLGLLLAATVAVMSFAVVVGVLMMGGMAFAFGVKLVLPDRKETT